MNVYFYCVEFFMNYHVRWKSVLKLASFDVLIYSYGVVLILFNIFLPYAHTRSLN